jgi:hypothetical protein
LVIKALDPDWIRIGIQPKMLDPDPDEMNADPQPCLAQPAEGGLDVEDELGEVLAAPLPFRPRRLALLLAFCNIEYSIRK